MAILDKIKSSRKAAKEHKEKEVKAAEKQKETGGNAPVRVPYKHTPKHAAVDALSGAPSSWRHQDRPLIMQEHRRRSKMALEHKDSTISLRDASNLLVAPGPSSQTQSPVISRGNSYSQFNPTWNDRTGDINYSHEPRRPKASGSRGHSHNDSGIGPSPLGSKANSQEGSPIISRGNSTTSSSENLEMAGPSNAKIPTPAPATEMTYPPESSSMAAKRQPMSSNFSRTSMPSLNVGTLPYSESEAMAREAADYDFRSHRPRPIVYSEQDVFDRLHTSTNRKLGEAPLYGSPPVKPKARIATITVPEKTLEKPEKKGWSFLGKKNNASTVS